MCELTGAAMPLDLGWYTSVMSLLLQSHPTAQHPLHANIPPAVGKMLSKACFGKRKLVHLIKSMHSLFELQPALAPAKMLSLERQALADLSVVSLDAGCLVHDLAEMRMCVDLDL